MIFQVDLYSPKPIYQQLIDQVKQALASGRLQPGERLPSIRDVAVELRVNKNTVARVYADLEREGLLVTRTGQGCFATDRGATNLNARAIKKDLDAAMAELLAQARVYHYPRERLIQMFHEHLETYYPDPDDEPESKGGRGR